MYPRKMCIAFGCRIASDVWMRLLMIPNQCFCHLNKFQEDQWTILRISIFFSPSLPPSLFISSCIFHFRYIFFFRIPLWTAMFFSEKYCEDVIQKNFIQIMQIMLLFAITWSFQIKISSELTLK